MKVLNLNGAVNGFALNKEQHHMYHLMEYLDVLPFLLLLH